MAYHGLIPTMQNRLTTMKKPPTVLEVGVDKGVTLIPLVIAMASSHESFTYIGVDINVQESVKLITKYLGPAVSNFTFLFQENSLSLLPRLVEQGMKFDIILLDGDHNYHTVSQELQYIEKLLNPDGFVVIDDYDGKWSDRDLWYAERPGYEENTSATRPVDTEKHGVKPAVDDWLTLNPNWSKTKPMNGEPVVLSRLG
jgi:predicted O-methyltransferase YrrM